MGLSNTYLLLGLKFAFNLNYTGIHIRKVINNRTTTKTTKN